MRIAGIIAEYDPFHKGHAAHIAATRAPDGGQATHVIAVMSGSFTQRGEPAMLSKFTRAEMALAAGADLVIELPLPWAMAPAENFANGGIALLNALGCVDVVSFGSECGDVDTLRELAALNDNSSFCEKLQQLSAQGVTYASAVQTAAAKVLGNEKASALASPNNTLGIEYIRAMQRQGADMDVYTLMRQGASHNEDVPNNGIASASYIRNLIHTGEMDAAIRYVPQSTSECLINAVEAQHAPINKERLAVSLPAILRKMTEEDFAHLPWMSEGLENRFYKASRTASDYDELLETVKTKRYPASRLRRIAWSALIGIRSQDALGLPPYIRILAMNRRGREILSVANPSLPILTRPAQLENMDERSRKMFQLESIATDLHALGMPNPLPCSSDYTQKLIVKE
ncbi:MAG: nucleotidyltransferase family protein [Clostridia bacterium]|nr:nucleotidyltransferase family protein [Clostridia bacterium]